MAKSNVFLHLGSGIIGVDAPHTALRHNHSLAQAGLSVPPLSGEHMERADLEMRLAWKDAGLKRRQVEGAWAEVCRKAYKAKGDVVISQPGLLAAPAHQAALAVDGLFAMRVHLVLTPSAAPDDLDEALGPWASLVPRAERRHVIPVGPGMSPPAFAVELAALAVDVRRERAERRLLRRSPRPVARVA